MGKILKERVVGKKMVAGTAFSITCEVERRQYGTSKPEWVYTHRLCNGTPEWAKTFKTKKAALAFFEESIKKVERQMEVDELLEADMGIEIIL